MIPFSRRVPSILAAALVAIGVGAAVSVYSVRRAVAPDALPYPAAERLVTLRVGGPSWSPGMLEALSRSDASPFDRLVGVQERDITISGVDAGPPQSLRIESVSSAYFEILGVTPALGRTFSAAEDARNGRSPIVVISDRLWRRQFGGDRAITGRSLVADGHALQIVGVLPPQFNGLIGRADLWAPLGSARWLQGDTDPERPTSRWFEVIARVAPGVSTEQARARFEPVMRRALAGMPPGIVNERTRFTLVPLGVARVPAVIPAAVNLLTIAVVALVVLVTVNAAGLHAVRLEREARDQAVRVALGAGRRHLWRAAAVEALGVAAVATAGGLLLRPLLLSALAAIQPRSTTSFGVVTAELLTDRAMATDLRVVLMAGAVALIAVAPMALWAVWRSVPRVRSVHLISGRGTTRAARTMVPALLAIQATLACAVVGGGALLARATGQILNADRGYRPDNVVIGAINLPDRYDAAGARQFFVRLLDQLRTAPGVTAVSVANCVPGAGRCRRTNIDHVDGQPLEQARQPTIGLHYASDGHLSALGATLASGRFFDASDVAAAPRVAVVSEGLAEQLWPDRSAIGHTLDVFTADGALAGSRTVVGVVRHIAYDAEHDNGLDVFLPAAQAGWTSGVTFVRGGVSPVVLAAAVASIDPDVAVTRLGPMADTLGRALAVESFLKNTMLAFGLTALTLTAFGMFAAVSQQMRDRTREIGLRIALGATPGQIRRLVVRSGLATSAVAVVAGSLGALWAGYALRGFLHGVRVWDPVAMTVGPLMTLVAIGVAVGGPAARAASSNPVDALKAD